MARKSPTVLLMGRSVNRHLSLRDGSGTVTCGRPLKYSTVTSVTTRKEKPVAVHCVRDLTTELTGNGGLEEKCHTERLRKSAQNVSG
jgi:hypothetical protein